MPVYCHNWLGLERYRVRAEEPLGSGRHRLRFDFDHDGGGVGRGGTGRLLVGEIVVGEGRIEQTVPLLFSYDDTLDVGQDTGTPVVEDYATPRGRFTGKISWVRIATGDGSDDDPAGREKALLVRQ